MLANVGPAAAVAPSKSQHPAHGHKVAVHRQALTTASGSLRQARAQAATAATVGGSWTELGPQPINGLDTYGQVSGRVTALAAKNSTVYAGTADGGVWKSTDSGGHWAHLTDNQVSLAIGALAVDWSTAPETIYAGTGEANHCYDCLPSQGVLISKDAGTTWSLSGASTFTASAFYFAGLTVDSSHAQGVLAATNHGVYQTTDGGTTWNPISTGPGRADEVLQDPGNPKLFWTAETTSCNSSPSAGTIGIWDTTGTPTWTQLWPKTGQPNFGSTTTVRIGLGLATGGTGTTAYAALANCQFGQLEGVLKTTNGGAGWTVLGNAPDFFSTPPPTEYQGWYDNVVAVDPSNSSDAMFGGITLDTTMDGGTTFNDVARPYSGGPVHPDFHAIAFNSTGTVYAGNDGGVWSTTNFGASWTDLNATLAVTQFYGGTSLDFSHMIGGSQDNGTAGIVPNGPAQPAWASVFSGDGGPTAMIPGQSTFFASQPGLGIFQVDYASATWTDVSPCSSSTDPSCSNPTDFIAPYVMDPTSSTPGSATLYAGTNQVYRTTSGGGPAGGTTASGAWKSISGDLTTGTTIHSAGDFLHAMSIGSNAATVMTGSWFGKVWLTTNANAATPTWTDVTGNLPAYASAQDSGNAWVTAVAINPLNSTEGWVTIGTVSGPRIFHTNTAGSSNSWTDITGTFPTSLVAVSMLVDPKVPQNVYVGTESGVYICQTCATTAAVGNWSPLGTGLPNVRVDGLSLTRDLADVVAWSHGRGAWWTQVPLSRPGADLSPPAADYGNVNLGFSSAAKIFTLKNTGSAPLAITSITTSGDYAQTNNCGAALAAGASCNINVTFTPTAVQTRTGTLSVNDNAADSPQTASLTGYGSEGYWMVARDGGIFTFGNLPFYGSEGGRTLNKPIVGMARTPDDGGYWLVASDGGIFTHGDAPFKGSTGSLVLNKPIVGMAATPSGQGYWLVASDGGIFTFGDAPFKGSTGSMVLNKPIVGMAATSSGQGYWLVASDGGIFTFGDAVFKGSTGSMVLNKPIVGMAATSTGQGYWLVASDGGIFTFGDATFHGSEGGIALNQPIVGMAATRNSQGYWLVASDGGIFTHGNALFYGSTGSIRLNQPIVGMAGS